MGKPPQDEASKSERRAAMKDRLSMVGVVLILLVLVLMMIDGSIMNFQCSLWEFVTFECNRWDASFKRWE